MRRTIRLCAAGALATSVLVAMPASASNHLETVLTGVDNGRGVTFDAAGTLFVASSGIGDPAYTNESYDTDAGHVRAQAPRAGTSCYGETGAILRLPNASAASGEAADDHVLIGGLPSHAGLQGAEGIGPADVSIGSDGMLYYTMGLGADPAVRGALTTDGAAGADEFATLRMADPADGSGDTEVADLGDHEASDDPDGQGPDSNPFGLVAGATTATVLDSGGNTVLEVALSGGAVTTGAVLPNVVVPIPTFVGAPSGTNAPAQAVPTGLAALSGGGFAIGQLTGFPFAVGAAGVWTYDGDVAPWATGFTNIMDVAQGPDGAVYVLELAHDGLLNAEGLPAGALVRVTLDGSIATRELLADDLPMPGGMAFDPTEAGMLYMTTVSGGADGAVVRFDTAAADPILTVVDDTATTDEDETVTVDVLSNDTGAASVTPLGLAQGAESVDGSELVYLPKAHMAGEDHVPYRACDADGGHCLNGVLTMSVDQTATDRIAGASRLETAVEASMAYFPDGAPQVLVAREDLYPDALAAGPLAAAVGGPILLTASDSLSPATAAELQRLAPGTVHVLGGPVAVSDAVFDAIEAIVPDTQRIAGDTRYETAVEIMNTLETVSGNAAVNAFVVEGYDPDPNRGWPDAVAISGTAANTGTPILLVETDRLPAETASAINGLGSVTTVGGPVAIDADVEAQIRSLVGELFEIEGATRYETSQKIAEAFDQRFGGVEDLTLVSGGNWPDALVAGPLVGPNVGALMLVHPTDLGSSPATVEFIQEHGPFADIDLFGGPVAISAEVEAGIAAANE